MTAQLRRWLLPSPSIWIAVLVWYLFWEVVGWPNDFPPLFPTSLLWFVLLGFARGVYNAWTGDEQS